jgi:hypothetical protein
MTSTRKHTQQVAGETVKPVEALVSGDTVLVYGYDEHGMGTDFRYIVRTVRHFKNTVRVTWDGCSATTMTRGTELRTIGP